MNFAMIALEEIADDIEEKIRYNSLSHRLSKLEEKEFTEFMKEIEPKDEGKHEPIVVNHLAQLKQAMQG